MKTVTIPTCANPFVVIVNGIEYTYPAGATVEVPDDVAAVIEQHDEAHSKHAPAPVVPPFAFVPSTGGGGGGGGGGDVIISLNECGIDLIAFMVLGGGVQNFTGEAPSRLFVLIGEALAAGKTPTFKNEFEYVGNEVMYLNPLYVSDSRLAFKFALAFDGLMEATAYLGKVSDGVEVTAIVETHTIS